MKSVTIQISGLFIESLHDLFVRSMNLKGWAARLLLCRTVEQFFQGLAKLALLVANF